MSVEIMEILFPHWEVQCDYDVEKTYELVNFHKAKIVLKYHFVSSKKSHKKLKYHFESKQAKSKATATVCKS